MRPIVDYATQIRKANPRGVVAVYIPEYVVGRWWEQLLHNQTALRLKGRLLFTPGVMVTSVPYQLQSSQIARERAARELARVKAGDLRRGTVDTSRQVPGRAAKCPVTGSRPSRPARRQRRERAPRGASQVGERFEAEVGPVAHGGHCVVRHDDRVVFVRHALPGERVVVVVTEGRDGDRFWRGDAVSVLVASPRPGGAAVPLRRAGPVRRVRLPARHLCGQRALKAAVVREQLCRLAGLDLAGDRRGGAAALRWRTRMRYVALPGGAEGSTSTGRTRWSRSTTASSMPEARAGSRESVETTVGQPRLRGRRRRLLAVARRGAAGPGGDRALAAAAAAGGAGARPLRRRRALRRVPGRCGRTRGAGGGRRGLAAACRDARVNLPPQVQVAQGAVDRVLASSYDEPFDLVVLDPPREGARRAVVEQVADRAPRAVAYVACDPAALARDLATFAEAGYSLRELRAFDLFPMTHHVECVALLTKTGSGLR